MCGLFHFSVTAFDFFKVHIHTVYPAVDEATQDFSCGLKDAGNSDRGNDHGNSGWIGLMSNRSICRLQAKKNDAEDSYQNDREQTIDDGAIDNKFNIVETIF